MKNTPQTLENRLGHLGECRNSGTQTTSPISGCTPSGGRRYEARDQAQAQMAALKQQADKEHQEFERAPAPEAEGWPGSGSVEAAWLVRGMNYRRGSHGESSR